ncbi:hypothetical protein [Saccharothrix longispora]|uniref:hypothetical protein n=1 Tax=Saccharothrix longispora TaxID=33920 RepID=UPI0028FDB791|nr:hypothetical protein [Saccharothrix longispora]MDU0294337.1 hypothetical protein [Saccharothrix longispora]
MGEEPLMKTLITVVTAVLACTTAIPAAAQVAAGEIAACGTYAADRATSRSEVQARAQSWMDERVAYGQGRCHSNRYGSYRSDCSGFVSMAWGLAVSRNTSSLGEVSVQIDRADLRPGDALNRSTHAALFIRWADAARTQPVVREHTGPDGAAPVERTWSAQTASAYTPIRYRNIVEG